MAFAKKVRSNINMIQNNTHPLALDIDYLKACDRLSQNGFDSRFYQSSELAVCDVVQSLIQHMPHKNKIAIISKGSHLIETVVAIALKNQNQIIYKKDDESVQAFIENLDSNVHCIYWVLEHEITGEIFYSKKDYTEILSQMNRKKIFSVQLTTGLTSQILNEIHMNELAAHAIVINVPGIFEYRENLTAVFFSDKQKIQLMLSSLQNSFNLNEKIKKWEWSYVTSSSDILNDRIVLTLEKTAAKSVKEYLKLNHSEAFVITEYPSWLTDRWQAWWPETENINYLKNTLILSQKYIQKNPLYIKIINDAEIEIEKQSVWAVGMPPVRTAE